MKAAASIVQRTPATLNCAPEAWQSNLCTMAACSVAEPTACLQRVPKLMPVNHMAVEFVARRMLLEECWSLTPAEVYGQHSWSLGKISTAKVAQRLQFIAHRSQLSRLQPTAAVVAAAGGQQMPVAAEAESPLPLFTVPQLTHGQQSFLEAVGCTKAEWDAFAAAHPAEECPLYLWALEQAQAEVQRLEAALPAELQGRKAGSYHKKRSPAKGT